MKVKDIVERLPNVSGRELEILREVFKAIDKICGFNDCSKSRKIKRIKDVLEKDYE